LVRTPVQDDGNVANSVKPTVPHIGWKTWLISGFCNPDIQLGGDKPIWDGNPSSTVRMSDRVGIARLFKWQAAANA